MFNPAVVNSEKKIIYFLLVLITSRIITEMYKQFIRVEDQKIYKIPSQVHLFKYIPQNKLQRLLLGSFVPVFLGIGTNLAITLPSYFTNYESSIFIGLLAGFLIALGGGYKDGFFEGFDHLKFFRSPIITALAALFLSTKTSNPLLLFFASMGLERMIVEFYKGFIKAGYVPGKFKTNKPRYTEWVTKRKLFIFPYFITWFVVLALIVYDI